MNWGEIFKDLLDPLSIALAFLSVSLGWVAIHQAKKYNRDATEALNRAQVAAERSESSVERIEKAVGEARILLLKMETIQDKVFLPFFLQYGPTPTLPSRESNEAAYGIATTATPDKRRPAQAELPPELRRILKSWQRYPANLLLLAAITNEGIQTREGLLAKKAAYRFLEPVDSGLRNLLQSGVLQGSPERFRLSSAWEPPLRRWVSENAAVLARLIEQSLGVGVNDPISEEQLNTALQLDL
jgi:hypothetical protein